MVSGTRVYVMRTRTALASRAQRMQAGSCTGIRMARLRDITADLQGRLDLIDPLRRDEDERHSDALEALDRQLRN